MRKRKLLLALTPVFAVVLAAPMAGASQNQQQTSTQATTQYVVVYGAGATDAARASIAQSGGQIVRENADVGVATVQSTDTNFVGDLSTKSGIEGVAHNTHHRQRAQPQARRTSSGTRSRRPGVTYAGHECRPTPRREDAQRRAARRSAVGHAADRRDGRRLVPRRAG